MKEVNKDKERLEEIEGRVLVDKVYYKYLDGTKGHWGKVYTLSEEDYNYLIEQAKRAQKNAQDLDDMDRQLYSEQQQNKRYRKALEFYAEEEHYKEKLISEAQYDADGICISNDEYAPPIIYFDSGEIARKALEESE